MVHAGATDAARLASQLPHYVGALIVTGSAAAKTIKRIRPTVDYPILMIARDASKQLATEANPFGLPAKAKLSPSLFEDVVEDQIAAQRQLGCNYVVLSTAYIAAGDIASLRSAYNQVSTPVASDIIVCFNVDRAWLHDDQRKSLIGHLNRVPYPVAISLGDDSKPFDAKFAVRGTLDLLDKVEGLSMFRTDHLGSLEAIAKGGSASIGVLPGMRRVTPPSESGTAQRPHDRNPYVFIPDLHRYSRTSEQRDWFKGHRGFGCHLSDCEPVDLDSYGPDPASRDRAHLHNARALADVAAQLISTPHARRTEWLARRYLDAALAHRTMGERIGQHRPAPEELRYFLSEAFQRVGWPVPEGIL